VGSGGLGGLFCCVCLSCNSHFFIFVLPRDRSGAYFCDRREIFSLRRRHRKTVSENWKSSDLVTLEGKNGIFLSGLVEFCSLSWRRRIWQLHLKVRVYPYKRNSPTLVRIFSKSGTGETYLCPRKEIIKLN
jgi:hypothetical protein